MPFFIIDHVSHTYFTKDSTTTAVEDIHLEMEEGEFISFLGPSGCGKTTLLSIMAGLIEPTEGKVILNGKQIKGATPAVGYMLQQDYLFPWKTIEENILIGLKLLNQLGEEQKKRTIQLLHDMGLKHVEKLYPNQLSGGMRQRAALVRTLSTNPKMLLLDEPFSALDFQTKLKLEDLVFSKIKEYQKTACLVTHDIGEAIAMSDRIVLLSRRPGKITKIFSVPEELRALTPFKTRQHPKFHSLFELIWKELEQHETKSNH